jgi:hypothetical protein
MKVQPPDTFEEIIASHREHLREESLRRLKKRRDFTAHLFAYVLINVVVWGIWFVIGCLRTAGGRGRCS